MEHKATVTLGEAELALLEKLSKFRKDDHAEDITDEEFLTNALKIGLVSIARFYGQSYTDPSIVEDANTYMGKCLLGGDLSLDDLESLWEP